MMRFAIRLLPVVALLLFVALPAQAQTGAIGGKVVGLQGEPIEGATILIERQEIQQEFEVTTDAEGNFRAGVPTGTYQVSLRIDGRVRDLITGLPVGTGSTATADFDLRNVSDAAEAAAANAEADALEAAFNAGVAALQAKNYEEAVRQFTAAAEIRDTEHIVFANLAEAHAGARQYEEAAANYEKAIALAPMEAAYYNNLGIALANAGRIDEATAALEKQVELNPASASQAYFNLGAVLTNRGRAADAAEAFKRSTEADPTNADAFYQLGISYFANPNTIADAVAAFEKFIELRPDSPDAETARQLIAAAQGGQ